MKNLFTKCEKQIEDADIALAERDLGIKLPQDFIDHYKAYNGGVPEHTIWRDAEGKFADIEVRHFTSLRYRKVKGDDPNFTIEGISRKAWDDETVPRGYLPFARDHGANFFCIELATGNIYFIIHDVWNQVLEQETHGQGGTRYITGSLKTFVDELK